MIDAPQRILSDGLAQASAAAAVNLPRLEIVRQTIRGYREGDPGLLANTQNHANVPVDDSGVGDTNRIIIFTTDNQIIDLVMVRCKSSIHGVRNGKVVPCVYALLPNTKLCQFMMRFSAKSRLTSMDMFQQINCSIMNRLQ